MRSAFFGVFSSQRSVAPGRDGLLIRVEHALREHAVDLGRDRCGCVLGQQAIRIDSVGAGAQFCDILHQPVRLAAERAERWTHCQRFKEQRATGTRRRDDEDRPIETQADASVDRCDGPQWRTPGGR